MLKEQNADLDETKGGAEVNEPEKGGETDDEFEYDDEGNIIIPEVAEDDEQAEVDDEETAENDADEGESDDADDEDTEQQAEPENAPEGKDGKDAQIEELKRELAAARARERDYEALKAQSADTLAKLGVQSDSVLEGLEKVAAESEDMSLDDYRKKKAENLRQDEARRLYQQVEFEKKMKADLAEVQREFPETRSLKSLTEIENLAKFGRFRDMGLSPKEAYAAANPDSVRRSVAAATKQQSLNGTKAHLKSAVPKGSKGEDIAISKKELSEWRDLFPNLSDKEISRLYKESYKK